MQTRREVLTKCGAGLAAIIAAGKAPIVVVRSILASRSKKIIALVLAAMCMAACAAPVRSMMGAQSAINKTDTTEGWQNPYVTDGLIAMWDGIESKKGATWQNLIRNSPIDDLTTPLEAGVVDIVENGYKVTKANSNYGFIASHRISGYSGLTIEVVTSGMSDRGNLGVIGVGFNKSTFDRSYWRSGPYLSKGDNGYASFSPSTTYATYGKKGFGAYWDASGNAGIIDNGVIARSITYPAAAISPPLSQQFYINRYTVGDYLDWTCTGIIYCCRVYNRVLTSDEIAANYAVDKERFGLE